MSSFGKKKYTIPVIGKHHDEVSKDWYIFFRFKYEGKIHKFKRREGINRIKNLGERIVAIENLLAEIEFDLRHGWNPILDPKREFEYNPYFNTKLVQESREKKDLISKSKIKAAIYAKYFNKRID